MQDHAIFSIYLILSQPRAGGALNESGATELSQRIFELSGTTDFGH